MVKTRTKFYENAREFDWDARLMTRRGWTVQDLSKEQRRAGLLPGHFFPSRSKVVVTWRHDGCGGQRPAR